MLECGNEQRLVQGRGEIITKRALSEEKGWILVYFFGLEASNRALNMNNISESYRVL